MGLARSPKACTLISKPCLLQPSSVLCPTLSLGVTASSYHCQPCIAALASSIPYHSLVCFGISRASTRWAHRMSVTPYTSSISAGLKSSLNSPLTSSLSPNKLPALIKSESVQTLHDRLGLYSRAFDWQLGQDTAGGGCPVTAGSVVASLVLVH